VKISEDSLVKLAYNQKLKQLARELRNKSTLAEVCSGSN